MSYSISESWDFWYLLHMPTANAKSPGPQVIKHLSYSTQLSTKFIILINAKMPTIVGILIFISMIIHYLRDLKQKKLINLSVI